MDDHSQKRCYPGTLLLSPHTTNVIADKDEDKNKEIKGTYTLDGNLRSALLATVIMNGHAPPSIKPITTTQPSHSPQIGQTVVGRVTRLTPKYASVDLYAHIRDADDGIGGGGGSDEVAGYWQDAFKATLRLQDCWPPSTSNSQPINMAVKPGDLIKARIEGEGDGHTGFLVSITGEELGVQVACSPVGDGWMVPVAWNQVSCLLSGHQESRKCAKPRNMNKQDQSQAQ